MQCCDVIGWSKIVWPTPPRPDASFPVLLFPHLSLPLTLSSLCFSSLMCSSLRHRELSSLLCSLPLLHRAPSTPTRTAAPASSTTTATRAPQTPAPTPPRRPRARVASAASLAASSSPRGAPPPEAQLNDRLNALRNIVPNIVLVELIDWLPCQSRPSFVVRMFIVI